MQNLLSSQVAAVAFLGRKALEREQRNPNLRRLKDEIAREHARALTASSDIELHAALHAETTAVEALIAEASSQR